MKKSISICGAGFVGGAIKNYFSKLNNFNVYIYDLVPEKRNVESLEELVKKSKIIFVCLPTPTFFDNGEQDISIVEAVLSKLDKICEKHTIILKSTTLPNNLENFDKKYKHLNLIYSPEFLTEANANNDFENQDRIILGGKLFGSAVELFKEAFPNVPIYKTDLKTASLLKYMTNAFLATKVSFANEMYQLCSKAGVKYDDVKNLLLLDNRIGKSHLNVPHEGKFFFRGHCLCKDLKSLMFLAKEFGVETNTMAGVWKTNIQQPEEDMDWLKMEGRASSKRKK